VAVNKVVYDGKTLIDLSSDTVAADSLTKGTTAHDKSGAQITGTLTLATIYTGTSAPENDIGSDGDVYLVIGE
jgi:hypothetical protein